MKPANGPTVLLPIVVDARTARIWLDDLNPIFAGEPPSARAYEAIAEVIDTSPPEVREVLRAEVAGLLNRFDKGRAPRPK